MDNPNTPRYRRYVIITVVFILVSVVMLFWARDVIREVIVIPVSYLLYLMGILIDYTPQIFFWIVLLVIALRIAYLSISRKKQKDEADLAYYRRPLQDSAVTSGRVLFWANKVFRLRSGRGVYYTRTFHEALSKTLLQLLAYRYRMTNLQVEDGLKDGSLILPQEIREYALKSLEPDDGGGGGIWNAVREWISSILQRGMYRLKYAYQKTASGTVSMDPADPSDPMDPMDPMDPQVKRTGGQGLSNSGFNSMNPRLAAIDAQVGRVLKYMKEELEVPHDDTGL